jgi:hypothetical protein
VLEPPLRDFGTAVSRAVSPKPLQQTLGRHGCDLHLMMCCVTSGCDDFRHNRCCVEWLYAVEQAV